MKSLAREIEKWLVNYKKNSVKDSSYLRYTVVLKLIQRYDISKVLVSSLTSFDIQQYINQLNEDGYAMETIYKQYKMIHEFVYYAMNEGFITKPICSQVKLPNKHSVKRLKREIVTYDVSEQEALKKVLNTCENVTYYAAILMLETGMRAGEVLALYWSDIDRRKRCVSITKTIVKGFSNNRATYIQGCTKTDSSNRVIPLSREAIRVLTELRSKDDSSELIFHTTDGDHLTYNHLRYWIQKACREAGVPYYGQHVFRHTFATNCYYKGCDVKLLSRFLGHANTAITYNTYIHLYGDALEDMRTIID